VSGQSVSFSIICVGQNSCSGVAQLVVFEHRKGNAWVARRHKRTTRQLVAGSVPVSISAGGTSPVTVSVNKAGRKLVFGKSSLPVQVRVKLGGVVTQVGKVKFKGHKRSRHH
jgi:hypothetical protein